VPLLPVRASARPNYTARRGGYTRVDTEIRPIVAYKTIRSARGTTVWQARFVLLDCGQKCPDNIFCCVTGESCILCDCIAGVRQPVNVLSVCQKFDSLEQLEETLVSIYFTLPVLLNVPFADPPFVDRVEEQSVPR